MIKKVVTEYVNQQYIPINQEMADLRKQAEDNMIPIVSRDGESFLLNLLRIKTVKNILEIGTGVGYSTSCFALTCPETKIVTIEAIPKRYESAVKNFDKLKLSNQIDIIFGDAREELLSLKKEQKFDFVFIDAAKSWYREFWEMIVPFCNHNAIIISDNLLLKGRTASDEFFTIRRNKTSVRRMREYVIFLKELTYASTSILTISDGMAFSIFNREKYEENRATSTSR